MALSHLLPSVDDVLVREEALPGQGGDLASHAGGGVVALEQLAAALGEGLALGDEVVLDEGEGSVGEDAGADVGEAGVAGAVGQGGLGEAMFGDVLVGGGEDCRLSGAEGTRGRRVVVGVVGAAVEGRGG